MKLRVLSERLQRSSYENTDNTFPIRKGDVLTQDIFMLWPGAALADDSAEVEANGYSLRWRAQRCRCLARAGCRRAWKLGNEFTH